MSPTRILLADDATLALADAREQQQLLHVVSHKLRSPLARIQAALGLAQQQRGDDPQLQSIEQEIDTLNGLIDQRLRSGRDREPADSIDLPALLQQLVANNRIEADTRKQHIVLHCDPESLLIRADALALPGAIENVLRNALHYGPADSDIHIRLNAADTDQPLLITVEDSGDGVAPEQLETMFDAFSRGDSARQHSAGYGLGLAIARRTANNHGGRIYADNTAEGFRVTLQLPRALILPDVSDHL